MRWGWGNWASGPVGLPGWLWLALAERTDPTARAAACKQERKSSLGYQMDSLSSKLFI